MNVAPPPFGSTPCRVCHGSGQSPYRPGVPCGGCGGQGWNVPPPEPVDPPRRTRPTMRVPHGPDERHESHAVIAAWALVNDGHLSTYDATYRLLCSCGEPRRDTRLAATIWRLKGLRWHIDTVQEKGRLSDYLLRKEGEWPR